MYPKITVHSVTTGSTTREPVVFPHIELFPKGYESLIPEIYDSALVFSAGANLSPYTANYGGCPGDVHTFLNGRNDTYVAMIPLHRWAPVVKKKKSTLSYLVNFGAIKPYNNNSITKILRSAYFIWAGEKYLSVCLACPRYLECLAENRVGKLLKDCLFRLETTTQSVMQFNLKQRRRANNVQI